MIEYISGNIIELNPAHAVLDLNGIGYYVSISINTYTALSSKKAVKLYIHEVIREDAHNLFGFYDLDERELFRNLISVSGVGANTGIVFLSSLSPSELKTAIITGDVNRLKSVKGIGLKTAQRLIVELKEKLSKEPATADIFMSSNNTNREEALSALQTLGFAKKAAEKALDGALKANQGSSVEELIKVALKQM